MKFTMPRVVIPIGAAIIIILMTFALLQMRGVNTRSISKTDVADVTPTLTAPPSLTPTGTAAISAATPLPTATHGTSGGQQYKTPTPTAIHPTATPQPPATPTPNNGKPAMKITPMIGSALCGTPTQVGIYPSMTITNSGGGQLNWAFEYQVPRSGFDTNYLVDVKPASGSLASGQSQVVQITQIPPGGLEFSSFKPEEHPGPAGLDFAFYDNVEYLFSYPLWITDYCTNLS